jgi:hypothetical protein
VPVVITVVSLNILIALLGFYVAWRLWRLKTSLSGVADALLRWEQNARHSLDPVATPAAILTGQQKTASLRYQYAQLRVQVHRVRQALKLLSFVPVVSRWMQQVNRRR